MSEQKKWYAVYSKPRAEKKLSLCLSEKGIENYCPLTRVLKQWSDRVKLVDEPLFKSYVFVFLKSSELQKVRLITGVVNFVYWLGKPAIIKKIEIERIKRFLNEYENVRSEQLTTLKQDEKVKIIAGALMDNEAKVLRVLGNKVELEITSLGYRLVANIDKRNLRKQITED